MVSSCPGGLVDPLDPDAVVPVSAEVVDILDRPGSGLVGHPILAAGCRRRDVGVRQRQEKVEAASCAMLVFRGKEDDTIFSVGIERPAAGVDAVDKSLQTLGTLAAILVNICNIKHVT